ncbi:MAG: energy transducer TonB [Saprospiraceae bacterium]
MEKDKKKPLFIRHPEYPGGPKALTQFIYAQLRYPEAALAANAEGTVFIDYDIDYKGNVVAARVLQGLGHGCDEEACRLVRLLKFDVPKNRNMKVTFHQKLRVQFKKPAPVAAPNLTMQVSYTVTPTSPTAPATSVDKPATETYSYTVQF